MAIVDIPSGEARELEMPTRVSYLYLNNDGTFEDANSQVASVYIEEDQVIRLGDFEVSRYIRESFGHVVGVLHWRTPILDSPHGGSLMFVLGS